MIIYETDSWACKLAVSLEGSVVPRTFIVSFPAGLLATLCSFIIAQLAYAPSDFNDPRRADQFLGTFTSVLGFLIVFRTRIAYSRFWEAASFLQTIRGGWFNVVSSCFAFCSVDIEKLEDVLQFQHTLVRLMSLLYAAALHEVAVMKDNSFEILDVNGFDKQQFEYMQDNSKKVEILMQWIQRLIMDGHRRGTLDAPAPILSRVFQELAHGVVDLANAKRICRYPFPFPYAQIQALLLMFHWCMSVWIAGTTMEDPFRAFVFAFVSTFCLWSMHYTSLEIEQPYGDDLNDLPLDTMQTSLNDSLVNLLNPLTQRCAAVNINDDSEIQCKKWKTNHDPNARMKAPKKKAPKNYKLARGHDHLLVSSQDITSNFATMANLRKSMVAESIHSGASEGAATPPITSSVKHKQDIEHILSNQSAPGGTESEMIIVTNPDGSGRILNTLWGTTNGQTDDLEKRKSDENDRKGSEVTRTLKTFSIRNTSPTNNSGYRDTMASNFHSGIDLQSQELYDFNASDICTDPFTERPKFKYGRPVTDLSRNLR